MRKSAPEPPADLLPPLEGTPGPRPGWEQQTRTYRLITPLFGGGVTPGTADPLTTVRAASVRGQLRFWWRATRSGRYGSGAAGLQALRAAEALLWGAASTAKDARPAQVEILVRCNPEEGDSVGQIDRPFEVVPRVNQRGQTVPRIQPRPGTCAPAYAAFPLQPKEGTPIGTETLAVRNDIRFRLTLSYQAAWQDDEQAAHFAGSPQEEVEAALWAWETFGGIGARTRRGFGALWCEQIDGVRNTDLPPSTEKGARHWLDQHLTTHIADQQWHPDLPHLSAQTRYRVLPPPAQGGGSQDAWEYLIRRLKEFRQYRLPHGAPNDRGRSQWPEPDEIRRRTKQFKPTHRQPISDVHSFPRAAFGLPIVFHFKDMNRNMPDDPNSDPHDTTLQGAPVGETKYERLASQLILRPLMTADGRALALALVLDGPIVPPGGLELKGAPSDSPPVLTVTPQEARNNLPNGIPPLRGNSDVLAAFLSWL